MTSRSKLRLGCRHIKVQARLDFFKKVNTLPALNMYELFISLLSSKQKQ